jgi:BASS family bile acid:Na+ symporter
MTLQALVFLGINVSIFLAIVAAGMRVSTADLLYLLHKPSLLFRSLLVLNVLCPIIAVMVCKAFSLHPAVVVALVTLAIAPVSNIFSILMVPLVANAVYTRGLLFASTVLSVVLTPLSVEVIQAIYGGHVHVNPLSVIKVVFGSMLLPLAIGLAIGRWWPAARRWMFAIQKVSVLVLLACVVPIVTGTWSLMGSVVREGTLTAVVVLTLVSLTAGHVLGGPDEDDRTVLAHATMTRHPGVAIAVASLTDQQLAPIGVLLALLVSSIAVVPYTQWRKRRRAAGPPGGVRPPARVGT